MHFVTKFIAFLFLAGPALAQYGHIDASPSSCTVASHDQSCSSQISWSSSSASSVCVWRIHHDLSPAKWRCSSSSSGEVFSGIDEPGRTFELRANSSGSYDSSNLLDDVEITVQVVVPSGSISASPNPCQLPAAGGDCSTTVSWSSQDATNVCVWRIHPFLAPAKWRCASSSTGSTFETIDSSGRIFELRSNSGGGYAQSNELDSVSVSGQFQEPTASISASPNPCVIPDGGSTCSTFIDWTTENYSSVCVWRIHPTLGAAKWQCAQSGASVEFSTLDSLGRIFELRSNSGAGYAGSSLLDTVSVSAMSSGPESGSLEVEPNPCTPPAGLSLCTVQVDWSTENVPSACIWSTDVGSGGAPQLEVCGLSGTGLQVSGVGADGKDIELRAGDQAYSTSTLLDVETAYAEGPSNGSVAQFTGGSNVGWFHFNDLGCTQNSPQGRADYDIPSTFHLNSQVALTDWQGNPRQTTISQLQQRYASGQRTIRFPVFHRHCAELPVGTSQKEYGSFCYGRGSSSATASDAGHLPQQVVDNIRDFAETAHAIGFERMIISFHPIGENSPKDWSDFAANSDYFDENWGAISSVVEGVYGTVAKRGSGLPIIYWDLLNEFTPTPFIPNESVRLQYAQQMWGLWKSSYPYLKTVGFSIPASGVTQIETRVPYLPQMYGSAQPDVIDFHIRGQCPGSASCESEDQMVAALDSELAALPGYENIPVVIGETWLNDHESAENFAAAFSVIDRDLLFLLHWPRERGMVSNCFELQPSSFIFQDYGF